MKYCNEGNVEEAYNLLTDDCKDALYNSLEKFKAEYYDIVFSGEKLYVKENWYTSGSYVTYRIDYTNNILADGGLKEGQSFADYITVIKKDDDSYGLNIGQFIMKKDLNKTYEDDDIKVEVVSKQVFRMYEIYQINFTNKTENGNNIYDDAKTKWYIVDKEDKSYDVAISEIPRSYLNLTPIIPSKVEAKFIKTYNPDKTITKMVFKQLRVNDKYIEVELEM